MEQVEPKYSVDFKKHLSAVCDNDELFAYAMEYYDAIAKLKNPNFTREDFETLTITGKKMQPDAVESLFKERDNVPAQEVFSYLFIHNVDSFKFYPDTKKSKEYGYFSFAEKSVAIKDISIDKLVQMCLDDLNAGENPSMDVYRIALQNAKAIKPESVRNTVFHELSHVFETRTFCDRQFVRYGISHGFLYCVSKGKDGNYEYESVLNRDTNIFPLEDEKPDALAEIKGLGQTAITEILNERFGCRLSGNGASWMQVAPSFGDYHKKAIVNSDCQYDENIDFCNLIRRAIPDVKWQCIRQNGYKVIDEINAIDIEPEALDYYRQQFLEKYNMLDQTKKLTIKDRAEVAAFVKQALPFDLVTMSLGVAQALKDECQPYNTESAKIVGQGVLMEGIKNRLIKDINNPEVKKDEDFYDMVNVNLNIPNLALSFREESVERWVGDEHEQTKEKSSSLHQYSLSRYMQAFPEDRHILCLKQMHDAVREHVQTLPVSQQRQLAEKLIPIKYDDDLERTFLEREERSQQVFEFQQDLAWQDFQQLEG